MKEQESYEYDPKPVERNRGWYFPAVLLQLLEDRSVTGDEFILLGKINALCAPGKGCWPSNAWLAQFIGKSTRWVRYSIAKFYHLGLIDVQVSRRKIGRGFRRRIYTTFSGDSLLRRQRAKTGPLKSTTRGQDLPYSNTHTVTRNAAEASLRERTFGISPNGVKSVSIPHLGKARSLMNHFYQRLIEHRLASHRKDLPDPKTEAARNRRKKTFREWVLCASALLDQLDGDHDYVVRVMDWYFRNRRTRFVSDHRSMNTFCDAFYKLEKAMSIQTGEEPKASSNIVVERMGKKR